MNLRYLYGDIPLLLHVAGNIFAAFSGRQHLCCFQLSGHSQKLLTGSYWDHCWGNASQDIIPSEFTMESNTWNLELRNITFHTCPYYMSKIWNFLVAMLPFLLVYPRDERGKIMKNLLGRSPVRTVHAQRLVETTPDPFDILWFGTLISGWFHSKCPMPIQRSGIEPPFYSSH